MTKTEMLPHAGREADFCRWTKRVVTDKTMASREAATGSAEAVLAEAATDETEYVVTRLDDDAPYEVGDELDIPELGGRGMIVGVERPASGVTVGRQPYRVGQGETRLGHRVERDERG